MADVNIRFDSVKGAPYVLGSTERVEQEDGNLATVFHTYRRGRARGYTIVMGESEDQSEVEGDAVAFALLSKRQTRIQPMRTVDLETMFAKAGTHLNELMITDTGPDYAFLFNDIQISEVSTVEMEGEKGVALDKYFLIVPIIEVDDEEEVVDEVVEEAGGEVVEDEKVED